MTLHQSAVDLRFDEAEHRYWDAVTGTEFLSVTTFLKRFRKPFDKQAQAAAYAAKHGYETAEEVLMLWEEAAAKGTAAHEAIRKWVASIEVAKDYERLLRNVSEMFMPVLGYPRLGSMVAENVVFDAESRLCGTMDLAIIDRHLRSIQPFDWKTNAKGISDYDGGRNMLPPLDHLPDSDKVQYALQVSFYAWFYERHWAGCKVIPGAILHIDLATQSIRQIPVPYLKAEIEALVAYRINELNADGPTQAGPSTH